MHPSRGMAARPKHPHLAGVDMAEAKITPAIPVSTVPASINARAQKKAAAPGPFGMGTMRYNREMNGILKGIEDSRTRPKVVRGQSAPNLE